MNFENLKNMDVKDLFGKIQLKDQIENLTKDKQFLKKIGIYGGSIILFLFVYYALINPEVKKLKAKINIMQKNEENIEIFKNNIVNFKKIIETIGPEYTKNSKLFHSEKEVEGLYGSISGYASSNRLEIITLNVEEAIPVSKKNQNETEQKNPDWYKIPVSYEMKGNYLGYLKFRRALAKSNKVVNFDLEKIKVNKDGSITSIGTISIVRLP